MLSLKLQSHELFFHILHITDTSERHLLLHVSTKPVATNGIAEYGWHYTTEKHTSVNHGLDGKPATQRERHAPLGTHITHTSLAIELGEVIGQVGILSLEPCTACGEIPVVLAVVVQSGPIAIKVFILQRHVLRGFRLQFIAIVHEIPAHTQLQIKMFHVEVYRGEFCLELVVADVVVAIAIHVNINIIAIEVITQFRTGETLWMDGQIATSHQSLTQSYYQVNIHRYGGLQGDVEPHLHSGIFFSIITHTTMQL